MKLTPVRSLPLGLLPLTCTRSAAISRLRSSPTAAVLHQPSQAAISHAKTPLRPFPFPWRSGISFFGGQQNSCGPILKVSTIKAKSSPAAPQSDERPGGYFLKPRLFLSLNFDLFQRVEAAVTGPWTDVTGLFPSLPSFHIGAPKWPGAALDWPSRINQAVASLGIKQNAVSVRIFFQAEAVADPSDKAIPKLLLVQLHVLSKIGNFLVRYPHKPRCTAAAPAAGRAFELQTVFIPRCLHG
jgi:hypothetical protein